MGTLLSTTKLVAWPEQQDYPPDRPIGKQITRTDFGPFFLFFRHWITFSVTVQFHYNLSTFYGEMYFVYFWVKKIVYFARPVRALKIGGTYNDFEIYSG